MMKAFKMSDIDGDDLLSNEEVKALLTNFNEEFTDEEIDESIKAADKGGLISEGILPLVPLHSFPESLYSFRFRFSQISVFYNRKFEKNS